MTSLAEQEWLAEVRGGSVRDFFAELGVSLPAGVSEASVRCFANPAAHQHDDRVKSCSVNLGSGLWKCHGCGGQGNAYQAAIAAGRSEESARRLAQSYGLFIEREKPAKPKLPTETQLKGWRERLQASSRLISRLQETRGWSPEAIRRLGLGWDGERLIFAIRVPTMPKTGAIGPLKLAGVVRYLPGGEPKTLAVAGTKRGLFPAPEVLGRRPLWIVEGEPDAVAMWSAGLRAVAVPGAQSWRPEWGARLAGRDLIVVCDCDSPGRELAWQIARQLPRARVVDLEPGRDDGYDVGDVVREASCSGGLWQVRRWFEGVAGFVGVELSGSEAAA